MKSLLFVGFLFISFLSWAETRLMCWELKRGMRPLLQATVLDNKLLLDITIDEQAVLFRPYLFRKEMENLEHYKMVIDSTLGTKRGLIFPRLLNAEEAYSGLHEFRFLFGQFNYQSQYYNNQGNYEARLILPPNIQSEALRKFYIRSIREHSNAALILPPAYDNPVDNYQYIRLQCINQ
jgi:hypothetical protein